MSLPLKATDHGVIAQECTNKGRTLLFDLDMRKYIDAEKLRTEVNELRQEWLDDSTGLEVGEEGAVLGAAISILDSFGNIIVSIEQEQSDVDLQDMFEKEFAKFFK